MDNLLTDKLKHIGHWAKHIGHYWVESSQMKEDDRVQLLESQLKVVTENFEREMRARGFDPAQADNVALPSALATLFLEKQSLEDEIERTRSEDPGES